ncbi:Putative dipeptidase [Saitozyma sp. JCM 24511]|nr:Putative dipeptidase [Saitozyma sp. JCM 24511]
MATSRTPQHRQRALALMTDHPLIDSHVDLPYVMRALTKKPVETVKQIAGTFPGDVDVPRMRAGKVGGLFMSVWIPCGPGTDFLAPSHDVRDALEEIDMIQLLMKESDFQAARSAADVRAAFKAGKFATLIGVEGAERMNSGHMLGNSLSVLRIWAQLAFASSAGSGGPMTPVHPGNGLSKLGEALIGEMNRLGIMVDISHVSDETMRQAIKLSKAPVIFSHSNARAECDHPRNVPDDVLEMIGGGEGKNRGVVQCVFYPAFTDPVKPTLERVADHLEYMASKCGKAHVGIASDFDGMEHGVEGLEDASKYPDLIAEMLARGWTDEEVIGLMGGNLLRVMDEVDEVQLALAGEEASAEVYEERTDVPAVKGAWADYLPDAVRRYLTQNEER